MPNHEIPQQATVRFATNDLKRTLALIGYDKDGDTELRIENGGFLARSESSDGFARQAAVPLLEGSGSSIGFRVSNERLRALVDLGRELQMGIVARDGYSCRVGLTGSDNGLTDMDWECQRIPPENRSFQGKVLPGTVLRELLRVVEPFAFSRERSFLEPMERIDLIGMTKDGLVCHSPEGERVSFEVPGLGESPWAIPVEVLSAVRAFTRNWKAFWVGTEDYRSWVADGQGALVSWRNRLPVDVDVDANSYEPDLDQFVATVAGKKLQSALDGLTSRLSCAVDVTVLRILPSDRLATFEVTDRGSTYQVSVPIHIERNRLDGEIEVRFGMGSLRKVLMGTMGRSVQLRLHCHEGEGKHAKWHLRSIDSYSLVNPKKGSGAQPDAQPIPCRVTRTATSLARGRQIELG